MYEICPETAADEPEVEALYDLCFAPGRTALSSYRLRDGVAKVADLCLVLRDGAQEAEVIEQLRATMRESLASYKRPQAYKVLDALPKGSTGKILKREIDPS